ncbi:nucleoside hydrolase [Citrobacter amalonaticus]|uniref:nucleoside hydrolase n=1 Tax=Citrobacter amalonaticus TaxID=35703 RepID=UPI00215CCBB6|nr:nucleoside hydrolase [Citrobacter amalonaticus]MCR9027210.1 nucleoside hydrolase [Citrobacter amalonaticus]
MNKVIIDTDIGVDDAFAIAYAAKYCDVIGITTVFGNVPVEQAVKNAKLFCEKINLNAQIYKGCSRPLAVAPMPVGTKVHGDDGMGGVFHNPHTADAEDAISFIIESIKKNPGEITLIPIEPLTNISVALNQAPEIIGLVKQVVIMGGAYGSFGHFGNATPFAEFNFWKDPHAADQVLSSGLPITVVPLDVTHQVLISGADIRQIKNELFERISEFYLQFSLREEGFEGMALHDSLAVAFLIHPECFSTVTSPLRVVTEGICIGQSLRKPSYCATRSDPFQGLKHHQLCLDVDVEKVKRHFLDTLTQQFHS